jgi:signal transduction histidine kinase
MRTVAKGDFSRRIPPQRKDGKTGYTEAMYQDFNAMAQELSSIETLKTDFISNVSHEIKTPLAVIQNYAQLLEEGGEALPPADRREYTKTIMEASRRLSSLITNILKLNKLENSSLQPVREKFNLSDELAQCVFFQDSQFEKKNISLNAAIDEAVSVNFDPSLLDLVWNNLLSNAVKFTPQGGSITVSLHKTTDEAGKAQAEASVSDTGCGMDEATQARIFDKFYQADTSHATEGNGLGLALVKKIIDIAGGSVSIESTLGKGSTFTVRLPCSQN